MHTWWRSWWSVTLVLVGVAVGAIGQAIAASATTDPGRWSWRGIALCGAFIAVLAPAAERRWRDGRQKDFDQQLIDVKAAQVVAINDALDPLVEKLGDLVSMPASKRHEAVSALITQALASASRVIGPQRSRACFFEADSASNLKRLIPRDYEGRAGKPRTVFKEGTADGDFVIGLLEQDKTFFCEDVLVTPPPGWDASRRRAYRTFISVPASAGSDALGMISLDAPEPGDLGEGDVPLLAVIGSVIATGIKLARAGV